MTLQWVCESTNEQYQAAGGSASICRWIDTSQPYRPIFEGGEILARGATMDPATGGTLSAAFSPQVQDDALVENAKARKAERERQAAKWRQP
ncbi:MAG: hypothetical protein ABFC96_03735 [Thermoguttaceae bacterium]